MFGLDEYEEERSYILVAWKLEKHGNQITSYGAERQVNDWKISVLTS